jgi:hypothetical protein
MKSLTVDSLTYKIKREQSDVIEYLNIFMTALKLKTHT